MGQRTRTRSFGASNRENHDSSFFYNSQLYTKKASKRSSDGIENNFPKQLINKIILGDSQNLSLIPSLSLHLVVTSPPYNTKKDYDDDLSLEEYLTLIKNVFEEVYLKLIDGGRVCINLANVGRKPYIPLTDYISQIMKKIGYLQRGEIIWDKAASAGTSTAWGSWQSSSNPCLRDIHEYILVFSKGTMKRTKGTKKSTIKRDEFLEYTKSIWSFPTESAKKIGHPAPFPIELAYRCIQLYSFESDMIFDPFMGSGTTAIAALETNRKFFGIDSNKEYVNLANDRIKSYLKKK